MSELERRRSMMLHGAGGYTADSYVQAGLIFQLDGLEKGSNPLAWTDRKLGISFPYITGVTPLEVGVQFNGQSAALSQNTPIGLIPKAKYCTIEACFDYKKSSRIWDTSLGVQDALALGISGNGNNLIYCSGNVDSDKGAWIFSNQSAKLFSANIEHGIIDGVECSGQISNNFSRNTTGYNIIGYGNGYIYTGVIRSIRIYDRILSASEILTNQAIDNERFNLGLTIPTA